MTSSSQQHHLRKKLCTAIASLNPNAPRDECSSLLDNVFESYLKDDNVDKLGSDNASGQESDESNVTPLMIACDKSHLAAMEYLQHQIIASTKNDDPASSQMNSPKIKQLVETWGHPLETSSLDEGGNSASHHALMVGFHSGIDVLEQFWGSCIKARVNKSAERNDDARNAPLERYLFLISQPNRNRDTPIMMACVSGHEKCLQHVLERILSEALAGATSKHEYRDTVCKAWELIQSVFVMKNEEMISATNLACGHGRVNVIQLLIRPHRLDFCPMTITAKLRSPDKEGRRNNCNGDAENMQQFTLTPLVRVTYDDVKFCKNALENIDAGLRQIKKQKIAQSHLQEYELQRKRIFTCFTMIEREMDRIAADAASEILNDDGEIPKSNERIKKGKGKAKKRKDNKSKCKSSSSTPPANDDNFLTKEENNAGTDAISTVWESLQETSEKKMNSPPFITLEDGRVISRSQQKSDIIPLDDVIDEAHETATTLVPLSSTPKTLQSILESQYRQQKSSRPELLTQNTTNSDYQNISSTTANTTFTTELDPQSIEAKMESLCLDPSMLLLSSHGMAMGMSPCQLDAIESILRHQLSATEEARKIQDRLLAAKSEQNTT